MQLQIYPGKLSGSLAAVPSKSYLHRALIAAALGDAPTRIRGLNGACPDDIAATIRCLSAMGASIAQPDESFLITPMLPPRSRPLLPCGESGTTLRLLLPVVAALFASANFTGAGRLPERPLHELLCCLGAHGPAFSGDTLPLTSFGTLCSGTFSIAGNISSQYISGLLFALPLLSGDSHICLSSPLESRGYVQLTLAMLARFHVIAQEMQDGFFVPGGQSYRSPGHLFAEGDWSNAAFFLACGALHAPVTVTGLHTAGQQPDSAILTHIRAFGANVLADAHGVTVFPAQLRGITADLSQTPDLGPILAALGACASGETLLTNASRLSLKESDRVASILAMLQAFSVRADYFSGTIRIQGGLPLTGGEIPCARDPRIVMAAAIAATAATGPSLLRDTQSAAKAYPLFFDHFALLGGHSHVI